MKLELYYYRQCPFCNMVLTAIEQLGINKIEFKNTLENPEYQQHHMQVTGRSTVPCLYIDGEPMFESRDIIQWLKDNQESLK